MDQPQGEKSEGGVWSEVPRRGTERADDPPAATEARAWVRKSIDD
jgi:hypothetical protein